MLELAGTFPEGNDIITIRRKVFEIVIYCAIIESVDVIERESKSVINSAGEIPASRNLLFLVLVIVPFTDDNIVLTS